jgi:para-aminobenzoate synthetase/4-amino-4-deoxychorismate lyase
LSCAKERAENLMIVDLIRNDLGRIAEYGSVRTTSLFDAERYPTVWQLTSTVQARLRADVDLAEIFATLFPSGSVTGAPKRAAMQAIAELETRPRGVYCGAVGVCGPGPRPHARFAVAIRTATTDLASGQTEYGAGGGITWDSDSAAEWQELVGKMSILKPVAQFCGLFETMRCESDGSVRNGDRHLDRMAESADYIGLPFDRAAAVTKLATCHPGRVRLGLDAAGALSIRQDTLDDSPVPVRLAWCDEPVHSGDRRLFHKTTDRAGYERRRARRPDADDVLLVNERDEVTETTTANDAVRIGRRWWTPALTCGLLPGVERARLLEDGTLAERRIGRSEVLTHELAVISSLRGWRAATLIDCD